MSIASRFSSQGETVEEAFEMIKDSTEGHLEVEAERKKKKAGDIVRVKCKEQDLTLAIPK